MTGLMAAVGSLLLGVLFMMTGSGLLGTLLAVRAVVEGYSTAVVGLIMSAYFVGLVAGSLLSRRIIHRVGHIRAFAAYASLVSAAALAHAFAVTPYTWGLLRVLTGFCMAGLYMVTESWLNARTDNRTRGKVLSFYMITSYVGLFLGQLLLMADNPVRFELFGLASLLFSMSLVPVALTHAVAPAQAEASRLRFRALYEISPLGLAGCFAAGLLIGGFYGMGPIFARGVGFDISQVSVFMGAVIAGGLLLQWPIGHLSDRYDRRTVLVAVTVGIALVSAAVVGLHARSVITILALAAMFGGLSYTLYPLSLAHANDHIEPRDLVQASAGLLLAWGLGAAVGPMVASAVMSLAGAAGLFLFTAVTAALLGGFAVYRMTQREAPPAAAQGPYVPLPHTSAEAAELDPRGESPTNVQS